MLFIVTVFDQSLSMLTGNLSSTGSKDLVFTASPLDAFDDHPLPSVSVGPSSEPGVPFSAGGTPVVQGSLG